MNYYTLNNEIMRKTDGFFNIAKDQEAITAFLEEVALRSRQWDGTTERMHALVHENYYYDLFKEDGYTNEDVLAVYATLDSIPFQWQSFMAVSKFYKDYCLKSDDNQTYLETYDDRIAIVALYLAGGKVQHACRYAEQMKKQHYQPATPTFLNGGRARRGELVSCFLLDVDDSLNAIGWHINTSMQLSKIGGGVALNLSHLRGRGEAIKGIADASSGVLPVMKLLEDAFSYANQLGQRKGSGAAYLNIFHWDVEEFLDCKKINADEKSRIQSLSIGLIVPSVFFRLAEENEDLYVFAPKTVHEAYGAHLDDLDLDEMYLTLLNDPRVKKRKVMRARDMLTKIAQTQQESGYPYIMYKSNANSKHPLRGIGQVKMSNLCTEIFQLQEMSIIGDDDEENQIKRDISCNLGSINIVNVMRTGELQSAVHAGMDMLTAVSNYSQIKNAPSIRKANNELHAVGLGAMNLHGYFASVGIQYESEEAREWADTFFMMLNYYSIERSMQIARQTGEMFKDFDQSDYATGEYFERYIHASYAPQSDRIAALFAHMHIPTQADWRRLRDDVETYGLYHAYRLAIAPTQSISYIQNSTSSVMPITNVIETRTYGNATTYYPMPGLSPETYWYYAKSAYDMDMFKLIDLVSTIQTHIDQGISCTLFVSSNTSTRELARYYVYAEKRGLKSLYYTRTRTQSVEDCLSCSV
ncbi:MAG: class 1b ribonucleoside-diphosphate reductase subunit alpha [Bacilli bacterium]